MRDADGNQICVCCHRRLSPSADDHPYCSMDCQIAWRSQKAEDVIKRKREVRHEDILTAQTGNRRNPA